MRITQGTFSFLPDLTDEQIGKQVEYALQQGWAVSLEYTEDPHPRNVYWEMWGLPMFDLQDPAGVIGELPSLTDLDDGDLKFKIDFRQVYAAVLKDWLKTVAVESHLGGKYEPVSVFRS